jgi:hypothetical protein
MTVVIRSDLICPGLTNSFCPARELRFAKKTKKVLPVMVWRQGFVLTKLMDGAAG